MADEANTETREETTEAQDEVRTETESADQLSTIQQELEATKKALEETRKAQSGSDKAVQELRKQLEQKDQEVNKAKMSAEEKAELALQKLADAEKKAFKAEQKSRVIDALNKQSIPAPPRIDRLIGETDEETDELVKDHIEYVQAIKASGELERAKANGRTPRSPNKIDTMTFDDLAEMSRKEVEAFARAHPDEFDRLTGRK